MSEQPYTPDEFNVRMAWVTTGIGPEGDLNAEFDRWLDRERAVARREGQAEAWETGAQAQAATYGMDKDTGPNPYLEGRHVDQ